MMISPVQYKKETVQYNNIPNKNKTKTQQSTFKALPGPELSKEEQIIGAALLLPATSELWYSALEAFAGLKDACTLDCIMGLCSAIPACIILKSFDVLKRKK